MQQITWLARAVTAPPVGRKCPKCACAQYESSGCFRVNANGKRLDVWLIYKCQKCESTWNLSVMRKVPAASVNPETYLRFEQNDARLALEYGFDRGFLSRNGAAPLERLAKVAIEGELPSGPAEITVVPEFPLCVKALPFIAEHLNLTVSAVKRMEENGALAGDTALSKAKLTEPVRFTVS